MAGDTNRLCRLVTAYGLGLGADKAVQPTTYRVGQHADPGNAPIEAPHFPPFLTDRCLDDRPRRV